MRDATFRIRSRQIEVLWFFYRLISARAVDYQQEDRYGDRNASTVPDTDEWPPPTLPVNPGDYSYVVYVHAMGKQNEYFEACMGSLISPLFVLSLARCTYQVAAPNIRVPAYTHIREGRSQNYFLGRGKNRKKKKKSQRNYNRADLNGLHQWTKTVNSEGFAPDPGHPCARSYCTCSYARWKLKFYRDNQLYRGRVGKYFRHGKRAQNTRSALRHHEYCFCFVQ